MSEVNSSNVYCIDDICVNQGTYFFSRVNVGCGPAEERVLLTGLHAVADIFCECCKTTLGWKYVRACYIVQMFQNKASMIRCTYRAIISL